MAQQTRENLKSYFEKGDVPSHDDFMDLIDSSRNIIDEGYSSILTVAMTPDVGDYVCDGTADEIQINQALSQLKAGGGGKLLIKRGNYNIVGRIYSDVGNIEISGEGKQATVINIGWEQGESAQFHGAISFYADGAGAAAISNVAIKDLSINHNGHITSGISFLGNTGNSSVGENITIDGVEFYDYGAYSGGSLASLSFWSDYSTIAGSIKNITVKNCIFRDNNDVGTGENSYAIAMFADSMDNVVIKGNKFDNLYGTTISTAGGTIGNRNNWSITGNTFYHTKKKTPSGNDNAIDFYEVSRKGIDGLNISNNYFEDESGLLFSDEKFNIAVYNCIGFTVDNNIFKNSRAVYSPGHSTPRGNENRAWTFTNNKMINIVSFADSDGHYAGIYNHNVFYGVQYGNTIFGYGLHAPTQITNNLFYDVLNADVSAPEPYNKALVLFEVPGNVFSGNTIWASETSIPAEGGVPGETTRMAYVFTEIWNSGASEGVDIAMPNVYQNNTIFGGDVSVQTFFTNSSFRHIIQNNVGVKEAEIKNGYAGLAESESSLLDHDFVGGNSDTNGDPITNITSFGGAVRIGSYTLPAADGAIGQTLVTNGAGVLTWTTPG